MIRAKPSHPREPRREIGSQPNAQSRASEAGPKSIRREGRSKRARNYKDKSASGNGSHWRKR